jgi:Leucine-rich repeat (LRR) protein
LGNLSNLSFLSLRGNQLTGTIPTELDNLSNLTELSLSSNELTGTIPTELGNLSNLTYLFLDSNNLTGSIPTELGNLSNLSFLSLRGNQLTGTIPTELGNLSNLTELSLSSNELTGSIPTELGNLSNLERLFLDDNQLCGEIPVELKNLSNIDLPDQYGTDLQLDNNHLTATDSELIAWLDAHNPGWDETQTPCPQQQCKLQFSSATYNVNENGEQATITVTRTDSNNGAVSIDYATSDDSATAPDDYTQISGTLNWSDGDDADKTFTININDDTQHESEETFIVSLGNPTDNAEIGSPDTAEVTITDNDPACTLDTYEFDDTSSQARTISSGATQNHSICPVGDKDWIKFTLSNPSAIQLETAGSTGDTKMWLYNNSLSEIEYDDDDGTDRFSLIDRVCGTDELPAGTYYVKVEDYGNNNIINSYTLSYEATACQPGTLQFTSATYSVNENGGTITITVKRINGSSGAISVNYISSNGTATAGNDYTPIVGILNWNDGDSTDKTITIDIIDDSTPENEETFIVSLANPTGGAQLGKPDTAKVTITDNDQTEKHGTLQFSETEFTVKENVHTAEVIITVKRIEGSDGAVLVEYAASNDTAKAGSDYTYTKGGLRWEDGDDDDKTFTVPIINDDEPENKETFIVSLANPIGGAQIGSPDTATVTIKDDDFNCKKVSGISKKECQALVALYDSTDGENWTYNTGWKATNKPCSWDGVSCRNQHVTRLSLRDNNLHGTIPKDFFKLKKLESLVLSDNDLNDTSLNNFKKLKNLETLLIDNCRLSGKIPNSLMKLKKLEELDLNDNCLKTKVSNKLKKWLDEINPGWDETQTDCQ